MLAPEGREESGIVEELTYPDHLWGLWCAAYGRFAWIRMLDETEAWVLVLSEKVDEALASCLRIRPDLALEPRQGTLGEFLDYAREAPLTKPGAYPVMGVVVDFDRRVWCR